MSNHTYPFDEWWEKEGKHLYDDEPKGSVNPRLYAIAGWNAGAATTIEIFAQRFEEMKRELP